MSNNNNKMGMIDLTTIENCHLYIDILFKKNQKLMKENEILKDDAGRGEECNKCDSKVPAKYLSGFFNPGEHWVLCSCDAHPGWYCPNHSPGNECFSDEDCECCNPVIN